MALCSSNCAYNPPNPVGTNCKIDLRPGGLGRLILFACDIQFTDITDLNEWCTYKREGKIVISPKILGQKIENEYTEKLVNSCDPEIVTGMKQTIEWKDYNADDEFFTDFDFYNIWNANRDFYNVGFVTCDGLFYGMIHNYSLKLSHIIEENYNDSSYWMGSLSFNSISELKPVLITGLVDALLSNCANIGYYGGSTIGGPSAPCQFTYLNGVDTYFATGTPFSTVNALFEFTAPDCCIGQDMYISIANSQYFSFPIPYPPLVVPGSLISQGINVYVEGFTPLGVHNVTITFDGGAVCGVINFNFQITVQA